MHICHKCNEPIGTGDADMPLQFLNGGGSQRVWHFHPGCRTQWDAEQARQAKRLENIVASARMVH